MSDHTLTQRIGAWLQKPISLYLHILMFLVVVAANVTGPNLPALNFALILWVILLGIHGFSFDTPRSGQDFYQEKPKRHHLELGDDGELVEIEDEEDEKPKRQKNS